MLTVAIIIEEGKTILWVESDEVIAVESANRLAVHNGSTVEILFNLIFIGGFCVDSVENYRIVGRNQPRPVARFDGISRNIDAETAVGDVAAVHHIAFHTIEGRNQRIVEGIFRVLVVGIYACGDAIVEERTINPHVPLVGLFPTQVRIRQGVHFRHIFSIISVDAFLTQQQIRCLVVHHISRFTERSAQAQIAHGIIRTQEQRLQIEHT